ncbi:hypothetical protein [Campylobacter sp.]|uniref:hypothetical protein n=1 Tax=Campylobacter sp. TaxID=205 RepID=UPI002AA7DBD4|nr:hypothetical protein [Campylobacter sp.]MCI7075966.1 hypothetical protein [Campylobacter sp.]
MPSFGLTGKGGFSSSKQFDAPSSQPLGKVIFASIFAIGICSSSLLFCSMISYFWLLQARKKQPQITAKTAFKAFFIKAPLDL